MNKPTKQTALFSAAPDLLRLVVWAEEYLRAFPVREDQPTAGALLQELRAAIAKAEGAA